MHRFYRIGTLVGVLVALVVAVMIWAPGQRAADAPVNPLLPDPPDSLAARPEAPTVPRAETLAIAPPETLAVSVPPPPKTLVLPGSAPSPTDAAAPLDLIIPVEGIAPEALINTFDDARSEGRSHEAIDIIAPQGTPVLAAADGRILRLFSSEKGGLTIYQLGPDERTVYYYAHLDRYADVKAGQTVRQGQVIGYVGDTGNAVPGNFHLHFALWTVEDPERFWDGPAINPYPLLAGEAESR